MNHRLITRSLALFMAFFLLTGCWSNEEEPAAVEPASVDTQAESAPTSAVAVVAAVEVVSPTVSSEEKPPADQSVPVAQADPTQAPTDITSTDTISTDTASVAQPVATEDHGMGPAESAAPPLVSVATVTALAQKIDPYAGAPLCPSHNDTQYHDLWDAERGCHYDHTHNANPYATEIVDIFGQPGAEWGADISYPWQTHSQKGHENNVKHNGYKWLTETDLPVLPTLNWSDAPAPNAVRAVRSEYHFLGSNADASVRLHSFWAEMQICPITDQATGALDSNCGIVKGGGWWDTGILHAPYLRVWVPLPGQDPPNLEGVTWRPGVDGDTSGLRVEPYRGHSKTCDTLREVLQSQAMADGVTAQAGMNHTDAVRDNQSLWTSGPGVHGYNRHMGIFVISHDVGDCVDPARPTEHTPVCEDWQCRYNNSEHSIFKLWAWIEPQWDGSDIDEDKQANGRVTLHSFTDRTGALAPQCQAAGEDCVPYVLENAPLGWAAWLTPVNNGKFRMKDFDLSPPNVWWIQYPN